jgi:hypothetical protein
MNARRNMNFGNTGTHAGTDAATPGGWRAVGATPSLPASSRTLPRRAFTLTEILIVIGLIVLVISLAVPAFNAMTGGRSIDAATNQLSAVLGRVRMEAIGLQEPRGLMFYRDPSTGRVAARMVRVAGSSVGGIQALDLVPDRDPFLLPVGVGLQMVDDAAMSGTGAGTTSADDRYVGYNSKIGTNSFKSKPVQLYVGGVILFDQVGRLTSRSYGFSAGRFTPAATPGAPPVLELSDMGQFLLGEGAGVPNKSTGGLLRDTKSLTSHRSNFGFVLYDQEAFRNLFGTDKDPDADRDPQIEAGGPITPAERKEEAWLDANALPVLINRYNGTLIRGE